MQRGKSLLGQHIIRTSVRDRSIYYDPVYVDYNSYMYNEEVFLKENNDRALKHFKEKFKDKIKKEGA